ncbi:hypothetical protein GCM10009759_54510 [Kitasatospora saccharophila]|uniref:ATP-grasp target RiPP n=1 Tax=Kitasatospora saccharophila TaxID=407973 RepID=A0ABN2XHR3_9ACTN
MAVNWSQPAGVTTRSLTVVRRRLPIQGLPARSTDLREPTIPADHSGLDSDGRQDMSDKNGSGDHGGSGDHNGDKPKDQ